MSRIQQIHEGYDLPEEVFTQIVGKLGIYRKTSSQQLIETPLTGKIIPKNWKEEPTVSLETTEPGFIINCSSEALKFTQVKLGLGPISFIDIRLKRIIVSNSAGWMTGWKRGKWKALWKNDKWEGMIVKTYYDGINKGRVKQIRFFNHYLLLNTWNWTVLSENYRILLK